MSTTSSAVFWLHRYTCSDYLDEMPLGPFFSRATARRVNPVLFRSNTRYAANKPSAVQHPRTPLIVSKPHQDRFRPKQKAGVLPCRRYSVCIIPVFGRLLFSFGPTLIFGHAAIPLAGLLILTVRRQHTHGSPDHDRKLTCVRVLRRWTVQHASRTHTTPHCQI